MKLSLSQWVGLSLLGTAVLYLLQDRNRSESDHEQTRSGSTETPPRGPVVGPIVVAEEPDTLKPGEPNFEKY